MTDTLKESISTNGSMANESIVQVTPVGQVVVTIPRALAQALKLGKGDVVEFTIEGGKLTLHKKQG